MVRFGQRQVGGGAPCFVTFEAGPTHDSADSAKRLITHAADAGADAIKFQILNADRLIADRNQQFSYEILADRESGETKSVTEPLYDILKRRELTLEEWEGLKSYSESLGLAFFATVCFEEDLEWLKGIGCDSVKIASADVDHLPFIRAAARTGMCIQLDTGNATIGEIEAAVDVIRSEDNENIIIHHCPSGYPARLEGINLNVIPTLKSLFPYPIAFSDHSPGWEMDIAAIALGVDLVEKTITEDRMTPGIEHIMSIEPDEMAAFVQIVRSLKTAMGNPRRILHDTERDKRTAIRRSAHLIQDGKAGQRVRELSIDFKRPGFGLSPVEYENLGELTLAKDLPSGHRLCLSDLVGSSS